MTSNSTTDWIGSIIKGISTIFTVVYALFKALNRFLSILLNVNLGVELLGLTVFLFLSLAFYSVYKVAYKKIKG